MDIPAPPYPDEQGSDPPSQPPPYGELPTPDVGIFAGAEALAWGWGKFREFFGPVMVGFACYLGFLATVFLIGCVIGAALALVELGTGLDIQGMRAFEPILNFVSALIGLTALSIVTGAAARAALDVADGGPYSFIDALRRIPLRKLVGLTLSLYFAWLLAGMAMFMVLALLGLLGDGTMSRVGVVALVAWMLSAVVLVFSSHLAHWILIDQPEGTILNALKAGARLTWSNWGPALVLALLNALVLITSVFLIVGLVVTYPLSVFATAYTLRRFQGRFVTP